MDTPSDNLLRLKVQIKECNSVDGEINSPEKTLVRVSGSYTLPTPKAINLHKSKLQLGTMQLRGVMTLYWAKAQRTIPPCLFQPPWAMVEMDGILSHDAPLHCTSTTAYFIFEKALADNQRVKIGSIKLPIDKRIRRFCRPQLLALGKKTSGT